MAQYLKKKTFAKVMRGYSPEEVDAYIEYLLKKYGEVAEENEENKRRLGAALRKIRTLNESGADGSGALPSAASEEASERLLAQAKAEEQRILAKAAAKAEALVREAETEARKKAIAITAQAQTTVKEAEAYAGAQYEAAQKIYSEVFSFRDKLFALYNDHIELLETIAEEANTYFDTFDGQGAAHASAELSDGVMVVPQPTAVNPAPVEEYFTEEPLPMTEPVFSEELPKASPAPANSAAEDSLVLDELAKTLRKDAVRPTEDTAEFSKYLGMMVDESAEDDLLAEDADIHIDWSLTHRAKQAYDGAEDAATAAPAPVAPAAEEDIDFHDIDELFERSKQPGRDYSLTDEFDIVYSGRNSIKNVEEIVKQPLVAPEAPSNPKKRTKF